MSNDLRIVSRCLMVGGREEPLLISFLSHFLTETWSLDVQNGREKLRVYNGNRTCYIAEKIQKFGFLSKAESIESFIEDQAFSLSHDLATLPPHSPLSCQQVISLSQSSSVCRRSRLLTGEGRGRGGGEVGAKSYDGRKAWSSVNH
jgi:hypothetical protein